MWLPSSVRITLFLHDEVAIESQGLLALYGVEEEMSTSVGKQHKVSVGSFGAGKLQATKSLEKIELLWQVVVQPAQFLMQPIQAIIQPKMVRLGELPVVLEMLHSPLKSSIEALNWKRVAVGVRASIEAEDRVDGYRLMAEKHKGLRLDGNECSDFMLQINRFCEIDLPQGGLRINRLAKWNVGGYVIAAIDADGSKSIASDFLGYEAGVELDINSAAETTRLISGSEANVIIDFAGHQALEIIDRGDS